MMSNQREPTKCAQPF